MLNKIIFLLLIVTIQIVFSDIEISEDNLKRRRRNPRPVLIDVDVGIDDGEALIFLIKAARRPEFNIRIVGITCVGGNTNTTNCVRNIGRIFRMMNETSIPVHRGTNEEYVIPYISEGPPFHGKDGFGDAEWKDEKNRNYYPEEYGIFNMMRLARLYKNELIIIAVGPLTNLALASKADPYFRTYIKEIWIMGGNVYAIGNIKTTVEFNFYCDPEAAYTVLNTYTCPITLVPLETCHTNMIECDYRRNTLDKMGTPEADFMAKIEKHNMDTIFCPGRFDNEGWITYDQLTVALFIEPNLIKETTVQYVTVELQGNYTRGMGVVDWDSYLGQKKNTRIILKIDYPLYMKMLRWLFGGDFYK